MLPRRHIVYVVSAVIPHDQGAAVGAETHPGSQSRQRANSTARFHIPDSVSQTMVLGRGEPACITAAGHPPAGVSHAGNRLGHRLRDVHYTNFPDCQRPTTDRRYCGETWQCPSAATGSKAAADRPRVALSRRCNRSAASRFAMAYESPEFEETLWGTFCSQNTGQRCRPAVEEVNMH